MFMVRHPLIFNYLFTELLRLNGIELNELFLSTPLRSAFDISIFFSLRFCKHQLIITSEFMTKQIKSNSSCKFSFLLVTECCSINVIFEFDVYELDCFWYSTSVLYDFTNSVVGFHHSLG